MSDGANGGDPKARIPHAGIMIGAAAATLLLGAVDVGCQLLAGFWDVQFTIKWPPGFEAALGAVLGACIGQRLNRNRGGNA